MFFAPLLVVLGKIAASSIAKTVGTVVLTTAVATTVSDVYYRATR